MNEINLYDNETLDFNNNCEHSFSWQANVNVSGIIWDIYYCSKCLTHVKKERPCPTNLEEIKVL
ncbi:MAG: hypothetical protein AABW82_00175 [Nanoarchaeota archaeon]